MKNILTVLLFAGLVAMISCRKNNKPHLNKALCMNLFDTLQKQHYLLNFGLDNIEMSAKELCHLFQTQDMRKKLLINRLHNEYAIKKTNISPIKLGDSLVPYKKATRQLVHSQDEGVFIEDFLIAQKINLKFRQLSFPLGKIDRKPFFEQLNIKLTISIKDNSYDLNNLFYDKDYVNSYNLVNVIELSLKNKKYWVLVLRKTVLWVSSLSSPQGNVVLLFDSEKLLMSAENIHIADFMFNDFNKDGNLDFIQMNGKSNRIALYSLSDDNQIGLDSSHYVGYTIRQGASNIPEFFIDSLHTKWFGPNDYLYEFDAILKDSI